jgi:hypothetical protein
MSLDGGEIGPQNRGRSYEPSSHRYVLASKGSINFCLTTSRGRSVPPDTEYCFRDPVLGWGKQEGRGLLHIRKSWNNPEESPQLRERGAKLGERAFTDGSWDEVEEVSPHPQFCPFLPLRQILMAISTVGLGVCGRVHR